MKLKTFPILMITFLYPSIGFMTAEEHHAFNQVHTKVNKYFIPMCWFLRLLDTTKKEGRIKDNVGMKHILEVSKSFTLICNGRNCKTRRTIYNDNLCGCFRN